MFKKKNLSKKNSVFSNLSNQQQKKYIYYTLQFNLMYIWVLHLVFWKNEVQNLIIFFQFEIMKVVQKLISLKESMQNINYIFM